MANAKISGIEFEVVSHGADKAASSLSTLEQVLRSAYGVVRQNTKTLGKLATSYNEVSKAARAARADTQDIGKVIKEVAKDMKEAGLDKLPSTITTNPTLPYTQITPSNPIDLSDWGPKAKKSFSDVLKDLYGKAKDFPNKMKEFFGNLDFSFVDKNKGVMSFRNSLSSLDGVFGKAIPSVSTFVATLSKLAPVVLAIVSAIKLLGKFITKVKENFMQFAKALSGAVQKAFKGFNEKLKENLKKFNEFGKSFIKIAKNRIIRMIQTQLINALNTGLDNAFNWATLAGNKFADSMNQIRIAGTYLQNSIAAMLAPAINSLAPIIDRITDMFVGLLNVINQVFSVLGGKTTWIKAKKYPTDYFDAVSGGAGKAADALKGWLASFDEINLIPIEHDSGSGSGSGLADDYNNMFETMSVDNVLADLVNNNQWVRMGNIVADKLNTIVDSMKNWFDNVFRPFGVQWATNFADFFNGIVQRFDFNDMGRMLASGLNSVFDIFNTWYTKFNFSDFGVGIAKAINGLFADLDTRLIGETFANKWNTIIDTLYGIVSKTKWNLIGVRIGEGIQSWFDTIKLEDLVDGASKLINGISSALLEATNQIKWKDIGKRLVGNFNKFLRNTDFKKLGISVGTIVSDVISFFKEILRNIDHRQLQQDIKDFFSGIDWGEIAGFALELLWAKFKIKWDIFAGKLAGVVSSLLDPVLAPIRMLMNNITAFLEGKYNEISWDVNDFTTNVRNTANRNISPIATDTQNTMNRTTTAFRDGGKSQRQVAATTSQETKNAIETKFNEIPSVVNSKSSLARDNMRNRFNEGKNQTIGIFNQLKKDIESKVINIPKPKTPTVNLAVNAPVINYKQTGNNYSPIYGSKKTIVAYASGGFPEDGLFFANSSELVGRFANGKTAVANNEQIIEGIKRGVMEGMIEASGNGENINLNVYLDGKEVYDTVVRRNNETVMRTGMNPMVI